MEVENADKPAGVPGGDGAPRSRFAIFRTADASDLEASGKIDQSGVDEAMRKRVLRFAEASHGGYAAQYVFGGAGMSLCAVWFKSGFPVVLNSHDSDCLYYITAGSIRLGNETLGKGDGFFVPADAPYTYTAGAEGVELLEFRTAERFDIKFPSRSERYWNNAAAAAAEHRGRWPTEQRP